MIVNRFTVKNQQKITVGILKSGFYTTFKWFHKFDSHKETIVKIEFSSIDIERILQSRLFYKNGLDSVNNVEYTECILQDIIDRNIFIPYQVTNMMLGHRILLKRKLTYDNLHVSIYCYKGTLKAINLLLKYNKLPWSSKVTRTDEENKIISSMKYRKSLDFFEIRDLLIDELDYEIIDKIYDVETMELLLEDEEVPFKELIEDRLTEFTQSQDQSPDTCLDDYNW